MDPHTDTLHSVLVATRHGWLTSHGVLLLKAINDSRRLSLIRPDLEPM